jgi:hypothetical protein
VLHLEVDCIRAFFKAGRVPFDAAMRNIGLLTSLSGSLAVMSGLAMVTKHLALSV